MHLRRFFQRIEDIISTARSPRFCRLCGARPSEFLWSGFDFEVLRACKVTGAGWRPEAACPVCRSSDRERLVFEFLRRQTAIFSSSARILHIAPEKNLGNYLRNHRSIRSYTSVDLEMKEVDLRADVTSLPFSDEYFDSIICSHVLEHIPDEQQALSELNRVMKAGGWGIFQVPIALTNRETIEEGVEECLSPEERERRFGQNDHVRLYGRDYGERLQRAGFHVEVWSFSAEYGSDLCRHLGIKPEEDVYFVRRNSMSRDHD